MSQESLQQHRFHPRQYEQNKFVYPVVSRRSHGISIGVNLNPDKVCNFDCIYCQVDRRSEAETRFVEMDRLLAEIEHMLAYVSSGEIYNELRFASVPPQLRRLNDIAFSGDGEPTTFRNFDEIIERVASIKQRFGLDDVKMVLITNASMFHRPRVKGGLEILDRNNGEIWAKLDAGTDAYYHLIDRTKIPFQRILDNITDAAKVRPLVIQSLFMRVQGDAPEVAEIDAYISRLQEIVRNGGQLKLVQVYTVARPPAESFVSSLTNAEVDVIAERVVAETGIPSEAYYG
ncbi:radical SAM protein [Planctomicrobium piriforme]|uniref:Wyosine [tRNA(Phe)-imidazoG37] synthetase, radical SAM superfamily n=1 Tax=Planctomicrobium piriforme TaxID=1576369 RepID=A0A1I3GM81_9PLAN|nr:radical SAM protein [Planctomicrobium piriforme]SFI24520.1 Wyosine [tRNA(Phe)-imidazoG37] synthetase, radical SAM superfamily [Planctomicrobium piriforme]